MEVTLELESDQLPYQLVRLHPEDPCDLLRDICRDNELVARVLIDLRSLHYVDPGMLQTLARTVHRVKTTGSEVVVVCAPGPVWNTLHVVGFDAIVDLHTELPRAVSRWTRRSSTAESDPPQPSHRPRGAAFLLDEMIEN